MTWKCVFVETDRQTDRRGTEPHNLRRASPSGGLVTTSAHCSMLCSNNNRTADRRIKPEQVTLAAPGKYVIRNTCHALLRTANCYLSFSQSIAVGSSCCLATELGTLLSLFFSNKRGTIVLWNPTLHAFDIYITDHMLRHFIATILYNAVTH
jgi:hypothetical protein